MNHKSKFNEGNNPDAVRDNPTPGGPPYNNKTPHQRISDITKIGQERVNRIIDAAKENIKRRRAELNKP
jgi:hypothetical protein